MEGQSSSRQTEMNHKVLFNRKKLLSHTPSSLFWNAEPLRNKESLDENWGVKKSGYNLFLNENLVREDAFHNYRNQKDERNVFKTLGKTDETVAELSSSCSLTRISCSVISPDSKKNG